MAANRTKIGHGLARVLGIKLDYRNEAADPVTRGESVFSVTSADTYVEEEPTIWEWLHDNTPSSHDLGQYFLSLFPFVHWITRYNVQWLIGDLIAGITVGAVVVPQGMAYAQLAELPVQYGLYSSFMGVLIYWFFATSKDITIGPVAVLSTLTGNVVLAVAKEHPNWKYSDVDVAGALAIIGGAIVCFLGLARLGWLVDLISLTAISAFMTGSAINIAVGQVPNLMGITGFSSRDATYRVVINILKHLGRSKLDAAIGLTALTMLYLIRFGCSFAIKKFPRRAKIFWYASTLRVVFVILLYTLISWLVNRDHRKHPKFKILGTVPRGFKDAHVPVVNKEIISSFASFIPVTVIVLLIEHISISKSFGRVNNYTINPSQELVAIGVTNLLGPFLGAYPATGSFSRTAIKSKAGVRTPLAGLITAVVVLLAIYALTAVFFYIPQAALSGVIIHAVGDLITPPNTVYRFWRVSPLEVIIFFAGVIVTVFTSIENGIYTTVSVSAALLLYRVFKAQGRFLGKVKVHSVIGDHLLEGEEIKGGPHVSLARRGGGGGGAPNSGDGALDDDAYREIFLPIDHHDGSNPLIELTSPYPGIFIYRFSEGFNYPNASHYTDYLTSHIFKQTRRTNPNSYGKLGDRPWNDPGPRRGRPAEIDTDRPTLKAIILDFSSVNNVDITSIQNLIDVRNQLDRYASPDLVEWHFAHITNRWTKRALIAAGFGFPSPRSARPDGAFHRWKPVFSVAEIGGSESAAREAEERDNRQRRASFAATSPTAATARETQHSNLDEDVEAGSSDSVSRDFAPHATGGAPGATTTTGPTGTRSTLVHGVNRPLFHIDLVSALQSAIANVEERSLSRHTTGVGTNNKQPVIGAEE